jgi:hypothetical protein
MAVIDELVISLGLDPSKFTKGEQDAVDSLRKFKEGAQRVVPQFEVRGISANRKSIYFFRKAIFTTTTAHPKLTSIPAIPLDA